MFWLDSRPDQALIWGQAGGSLKTESAGVWWSSMSVEECMEYGAFLENQDEIEGTWDPTFGDRKNEIVFIGQDMNEVQIRKDLDECLATDKELETHKWQEGYQDEWSVPRASEFK